MARICEVCGKAFNCPPSHVARGAGRFCSRRCQGAYRTAQVTPRPSGTPRAPLDPTQTPHERLLARKRRYHARHREQINEKSKAYRASNKAQVAAKNLAWQRAHKEQLRAYAARWRIEKRDLHQAAARAAAANGRAKKAGAPGRLTRADVTALWDRQPVCVGCGTGRGLDHIVSLRDGGTNTPGNIQNLCRRCNALKQ